MEPSFTFTIPNEKKKLYDRFALLLLILNAAGMLIRFFFYKKNYPVMAGQLIIFLTPILLLLYVFFVAYNDRIRKHIKNFLLITFNLSLFWLIKGPWWVALLTLLLTLFYLLAQRELNIIVSNSHIIYPSFPKRNIQWNELNNLILKDGLLTIDFKNDAIIQHYPEQKMNLPGEKEFNEFCRERLVTSS